MMMVMMIVLMMKMVLNGGDAQRMVIMVMASKMAHNQDGPQSRWSTIKHGPTKSKYELEATKTTIQNKNTPPKYNSTKLKKKSKLFVHYQNYTRLFLIVSYFVDPSYESTAAHVERSVRSLFS